MWLAGPEMTALGVPSGQALGAAFGTVAICALLIGLAASLPGRTAEGVLLGAGTMLAAMAATAVGARTAVGSAAGLRLGAFGVGVPVALAALLDGARPAPAIMSIVVCAARRWHGGWPTSR